MHWSHECSVDQARREAGECVLCGDPNQWLRGCGRYDPAVHTPKNNRGSRARTTYFNYDGPRRRETWCLRSGTADHASMDCKSTSPPVLLPENEEDKRQMENFCCYCGYMGHTRRRRMSSLYRALPCTTTRALQLSLGFSIRAHTPGFAHGHSIPAIAFW